MIDKGKDRLTTLPNRALAGAFAVIAVIAAIVVVQMPVLAHAELPSGASVAGDYIVHLRDEPVALYNGGIAGYSSTKVTAGTRLDASSTAATSYSAYLVRSQDRLASKVGATITSHYSVTFDGFTATLTAEQAAALAADHGVTSLEAVENSVQQSEDAAGSPMLDGDGHSGSEGSDNGDEDSNPADDSDDSDGSGVSGVSGESGDDGNQIEYIGISTGLGDMSGLGGAWEQVGGPQNAGKGTVIGVVDGGITSQPSAFGEKPLTASAGANPRWESSVPPGEGETRTTHFLKGDGGVFRGQCQTGLFTTDYCNSKIIGVRFFPLRPGAGQLAKTEQLSPRSSDAHGPLVASLAAGLLQDKDDVEAVGASPAGIAPAAKLAIYKACWKVIAGNKEESICPSANVIGAIEAAVIDGVDVLNISVGKSRGIDYKFDNRATTKALFGATYAGVYVAAAAGNNGPDASTITAGNSAPWITTVASNTAPDLRATVAITPPDSGTGTVPKIESFTGVSILPERSEVVPLSLGSVAGRTGVSKAEAKSCAAASLDPVRVEGGIVVCIVHVDDGRPGTRMSRMNMAAEVQRAGGVGVIVIPDDDSAIPIDTQSTIQTIFYDDKDKDRLVRLAASGGATAQFKGGSSPSPVIEDNSSRGPLRSGAADFLKPDVAAIGATQNHTEARLSGTSLATAVVSGLAAIYLGVHPMASPGEIKSALMTTAHSLRITKKVESSDVFAQGAGTVSGASYLSPGLLYLVNDAEVNQFKAATQLVAKDTFIDPSDLNLPSIQIGALNGSQTITRRLTSLAAGTWAPAVTGIEGMTATVSPAALTFDGPGITKQYTVTYARTDAPLGTIVTGYLTWINSATAQSVRIPFAVRPTGGAQRTTPEIVGNVGTGSLPVAVRSSSRLRVLPEASILATGVPQQPTDARPEGADASTFDYPEFTVASDGGFVRFAVSGGPSAPPSSRSVSLLREDDETGLYFVARTLELDGTSGNFDQFNLTAGRYFFRIVEPTASAVSDLSVTQYLYAGAPTEDAPRLAVEPTRLNFDLNLEQTASVSWAGLSTGSSYFGYVRFGDSSWQTAVLVTPSLTVTGVTTLLGTTEGTTWGGNTVSITGTGFDAQTVVTIAGAVAKIVSVSNSTIVVESPAHQAGAYSVVVTSGSLFATAESLFTYRDPPTITAIAPSTVSATTGGEVTITGSGFDAGLELYINGQLVITRTVGSANSIIALVPAGLPGVANVDITTDFGSADNDGLLTYR